MEIQAPFHILQVESYDIQHLMQYLGFLKFPLSMALEDVGSEVVLSLGAFTRAISFFEKWLILLWLC